MTERGPVDLVHLADDENSVIVRVAGPTTGALPWDGCLDVDIMVASTFAKGHLAEVCLLPGDLDDWAEALELLAEGRPVHWMDDGRNPEIRITPAGPYLSHGENLNAIEVVVRDPAVSLTSVCVLVRLPDGWVDAQRLRLAEVRTAWPFGQL